MAQRGQRIRAGAVLVATGLCLAFAEVWLVEADYYAFGGLSQYWWLASVLTVLVVACPVLLWLSGVSDLLASWRHSPDAPSRLAMLPLAVGAVEVVVAIGAAMIALVLLGGLF